MTTRKRLQAMFKEARTTPAGRAAAIRDALKEQGKDIYKEAYSRGTNLSAYLEKLDPSRDHPSGSGDAFQRVLVTAGVCVRSDHARGIQASMLEDIVENERYPQIAPLALELISRAYRAAVFGKPQRAPSIASGEGIAGSYLAPYVNAEPRDILMRPAIPLDELVGRTTGINQTYYKPFYLEDVKDTTSRVAEAAEIPAVKIATSDKTINLVKYGRRIDITYEANRRLPIDLLAFNIGRIAIQVESDKVDKVAGVLVSGDGNAGTAATSYNLTALDAAATVNVLTLRAWLAFKMKFKNPLVMTTALSNDAPMLDLMLLNMGSGNVPLVGAGPFFGAQAINFINQGLRDGVRGGSLDAIASGKIVGFDKRFAIERVYEIGSNIQESDKDVKSQINSLVLSEVEGYDIIDPKATKILNLAA